MSFKVVTWSSLIHCQDETLDNTWKKNSFNKVLLAHFVTAKVKSGFEP